MKMSYNKEVPHCVRDQKTEVGLGGGANMTLRDDFTSRQTPPCSHPTTLSDIYTSGSTPKLPYLIYLLTGFGDSSKPTILLNSI